MNGVAERRALAERLARAAGAIQRDRYGTTLDVRSKGAAIDLVTEVDRACEAAIVETLAREVPEDAVLAEEGGSVERDGAAWRWVIDPLDGTMNFAHAYPRFCVSIAAQREGHTELGVIYDPLLDELFAATRGEGATLDGEAIRVSEEAELGRALLATGFAYDVHTSDEDNLDHFAAFAKRARGLRRDGSAALDLCYVAAGRFDGYWELKLQPWDVAAGNLIVEEAGGRSTDFRGLPATGDGRETLASNGLVHDAMLALLQRDRG